MCEYIYMYVLFTYIFHFNCKNCFLGNNVYIFAYCLLDIYMHMFIFNLNRTVSAYLCIHCDSRSPTFQFRILWLSSLIWFSFHPGCTMFKYQMVNKKGPKTAHYPFLCIKGKQTKEELENFQALCATPRSVSECKSYIFGSETGESLKPLKHMP